MVLVENAHFELDNHYQTDGSIWVTEIFELNNGEIRQSMYLADPSCDHNEHLFLMVDGMNEILNRDING